MAENGWNNRRRNDGNPSSFCLPKLSSAFDSDTSISPTSILDTKPFSTLPNTLSEPTRDSSRKPDSRTFCNSAPESGLVPLENKLDIQITPSTNNTPFSESMSLLVSPSDFGIKTGNPNSLPGFLSPLEMEMSEDYTCVISHWPNPKTTHIYRDCILESYGNSSSESNEFGEKQNFLSLCYGCNKILKENDVYI